MRPAFSVGDAAPPLPYASLSEAILGAVETLPDGRFVYFDRDGEMREVSYRETLIQAHRLVDGLRQEGMRAGDALLLILDDARNMVPAIWACAIAGLVAIPADNSAAGGMPESRNLGWLGEVFGRFRILTSRSSMDTTRDPKILDYGALISGSAGFSLEPAEGDAEDLRLVILTSGTTARPKLVGLSDRAALSRWWPRLPDAAHAKGFLSWAAFGHVMGLGHAMPNLPLKAHLDRARFVASPGSWLDALDTTGATHATMTNFGMSLVLRAVADNPDRGWRLDNVRKIGIGAEAISRKTCERFLKCLAEFGLREDALILGYGLSECGPVVGGGSPFSTSLRDEADSLVELDRPTSGHAVRIVGDDGYLLREGETGRIEVCGPTMTSGYLGDEADTVALFTPDRWLRTGDLGFLREGRLTVAGREKELVIVNARKYTCQSIEAALRERTGFTDVYAAPLEDETDAGAIGVGAPCAIFVAVDQPDEVALDQVAEAVRAATGEAFRFAPRTVAIVSRQDVPRTSLGKARRLELHTLLGASAAAGRVDTLTAATRAAGPKNSANDTESRIARIWRELLRCEGEIDRDADFFAVGGDSLLALRMSFLIEDEFGVPVRIERFYGKLSISELARSLAGASPATNTEIPVSSSSHGLPDWLIERLQTFLMNWPGTPVLKDGFVRRVGKAQQGIPIFWCMQQPDEASHFERTVGERFPAYAMRSGQWLLDYDTPVAEALIDCYLDELKKISPEGPVVIGGTCQGVNIALALTRRLIAEGRDVRLLAAAESRFAELCDETPVAVPVALFPAIRSNFNPYRYFRHPEIGLRKLAPQGLRIEMIDASHTKIMIGTAMKRLADAVEAAIAWAETHDLHDEPMSPSLAAMYQCRITSPSRRLELRAGESVSLPIKVKNFSPTAWEPFERSGLMLGNHWLSADGGMLIWSDGRAPLKRRLEAGGRAYMTLDVVAPPEPGDYLLEVDLVEEGIRWFADVPMPPLQVSVQVRPRPEALERPARSPRSSLMSSFYRLADRIPLLTTARKPR